jgi:hypothetical protein
MNNSQKLEISPLFNTPEASKASYYSLAPFPRLSACRRKIHWNIHYKAFREYSQHIEFYREVRDSFSKKPIAMSPLVVEQTNQILSLHSNAIEQFVHLQIKDSKFYS